MFNEQFQGQISNKLKNRQIEIVARLTFNIYSIN